MPFWIILIEYHYANYLCQWLISDWIDKMTDQNEGLEGHMPC